MGFWSFPGGLAARLPKLRPFWWKPSSRDLLCCFDRAEFGLGGVGGA